LYVTICEMYMLKCLIYIKDKYFYINIFNIGLDCLSVKNKILIPFTMFNKVIDFEYFKKRRNFQ